jgi:hypothetical protein
LNEGKEIEDTKQHHEEDQPFYAKPTISRKVKDHELQRIADEKKMGDMAKSMITGHNDMLRTDRLDPNRITKKGFESVKYTQMASAHALSQMKKKNKSQTQTGFIEEEDEAPKVDVSFAILKKNLGRY